MPGNHFMKVAAAVEQTGISSFSLYDWVAKQKVATKRDEDGVILVSLDSVKAYQENRKKTPRAQGEEKIWKGAGSPPASGVILPGRIRRASSKNLARRGALRKFIVDALAGGEKRTAHGYLGLAKTAGIPATQGSVSEVLAELKQVKAMAKRIDKLDQAKQKDILKEAFFSHMSADKPTSDIFGSLGLGAVVTENPLLKSWWDRTILPLLESQNIRGVSWKYGGDLEVDVVTRVKL